MFTDPNKDVDDLIAIIMLNNMKKEKIIDIAGIVTTHGNADTTYKRAVFAQGVSKIMGNDIEVCAGIPENYEDKTTNLKVNGFFCADGLDYIMNSANKGKIKTNSETYLKQIFNQALPKSLDMLVIAQMTDLWNFVAKNPDLFLKKVNSVNIMGCFEKKDGQFVPDNSTNNANDAYASENLYNFLQKNNIQTKFVNRFAVMEVAVGMTFYENFKHDGSLLGEFVYNAEQKSIIGLYIGLMNKEPLARLTPEWFYKTFTNIDKKDYAKYKNAGTDDKIVDEVMKHVVKLNLYDPLTLIAAINDYKKYFESEKTDNFEILMPSNKEMIYKKFYEISKINGETKMKLTLNKAKKLVQNNPDGQMILPKIKHCLEIGRIARKIAEKCGLDGEKAEILGIVHDIGSIWNEGYQHPYVGYKYLKVLGYDDEYANVCLTHSFIHGDPNCTADGLLVECGKVKQNKIIPWENEEDSNFVLNFLKTHKYTEIEDIINLCDLMVTDKVIGLDKRLFELIAKKGTFCTTQNHINVAHELQAQIEQKMGCTILELFPEIIENQKAGDTYRSAMKESRNEHQN